MKKTKAQKMLENVEACACMERDGWKEGTQLRHKATGTEIILVVHHSRGAWWAMTTGKNPKRGLLTQIQIVRDYEQSGRLTA